MASPWLFTPAAFLTADMFRALRLGARPSGWAMPSGSGPGNHSGASQPWFLTSCPPFSGEEVRSLLYRGDPPPNCVDKVRPKMYQKGRLCGWGVGHYGGGIFQRKNGLLVRVRFRENHSPKPHKIVLGPILSVTLKPKVRILGGGHWGGGAVMSCLT